ncbi:hypothetical protein [Microbacterium sp. Marseille-Q6965]|uniref:hypothetical protein n=1 Tax=Microbacterium sp. Marseille-Q6965 TaxID=2965072 RepID=UPI0021B71033|nr:hypothetical protein [Microbacterium sp. Marseille-Q6965]
MSDAQDVFHDPEAERHPDDEREVDLDDEADLELPPPTLDPDERIEGEDPLADQVDEARGMGELDR